ncbi:alpha-L-rhamnosidase-related protein [Occultella gossypii]|uniref:Alpha-L-rhamnosidase n=1 Tax=Occultella gossypii TaxID=2800820 RepID=A0ABS7SI56_9MICO|nr:alpha-L-rhamnosidase C-terminal domain-containing protein [Occultella gossypii]MBZ2199524.1 hypothetical protein [Occultella gossypii]
MTHDARPLARVSAGERRGRWVWTGEHDVAPTNRFTWFRTVLHLDAIPEDPHVLFAADSTAQLWVNGTLVRRKVTRFHEPQVRADLVDLGAHLRPGANTLLVLHHSWGPIITFQRTGSEHAGLYLDAQWAQDEPVWQWRVAEELEQHPHQFLGVRDRTPRVRFPVRWRPDPGEPWQIASRKTGWRPAVVVPPDARPWPAHPDPVETPGQRESRQRPGGVLAAGYATHGTDLRTADLTTAELAPDTALTAAVAGLVDGTAVTVEVRAGEVLYLTVDMHRPVHGYPYLDLESDAALTVRLGYGEIAWSMYDGSVHVRPDGWVDVNGVVGDGYCDLIELRPGRFAGEIPDERVARWLTVHLVADADAVVTLHGLGLVKSQYPVVPRGSFACGDERIEQIVKLSLIHAEVTMSDTYVDTPGREDGQWIEDARPRALVSERWFGDTALRSLMVRTLAEGQGEDGNLHPFFPSNYPAYPANIDWSVQWVAMLWDDFRWTGKTDLVAQHWTVLERYWTSVLADVDDDGVWRTSRVFADIKSSDRGGHRSSSSVVTPWLIDRLRWSVELAGAMGRPERAAEWSSAAESIAEAFRRIHVVRDDARVQALVLDVVDPDEPGRELTPGQAAQVVPVLDGLLTPAEADAVLDWAFPDPDGSPPPGVRRWNNPTWLYRALSALSARGRSRRAVAHLLERFAPYLPQHPRNPTPLALQGPYGGPLPEYWVSHEDQGLPRDAINDRQPIDPTGSHGWAAVALLWLHESLLGVRVVAPGGERLVIAPDDAGLPYVTGTTLTPRGPVFVHWDPQQTLLEIELPADVTAQVHLPAALAERLGTATAVATGPRRLRFPSSP